LGILLLAGLGVTAILLRTHLRFPLGIPGRQGVLIMLFFMAGRSLSTRKIAGLYSALGASAILLIPGMGPKDPWIPLIFLGLGIVLDYSIYLGSRLKMNPWLLAFLAGGLAYTTIPLCRMLIHFSTGFPYKEFVKHGYLLPVLSHFIMGAAGSLLGAAPVISFKKKRSHHE
jgi:hypothetical protein